ncbi:MAG: hypothetical protein JW804_09170 [Sedimentisphaerales bacterium]|nr:hypothetical protein [Sedimentisphaerales bacterium]
MSLPNGKKDGLSDKKKSFLSIAAIAVVILLLSLFIFANSMTKPLGHDEHMYCTAGYMTAKGELIYRDFSYAAHLPLHPLLLGGIYKLSGTSYYLLGGRLLSVVFEIGILICIAGIYKTVIKNSIFCATFFGITTLVLYCFNPIVYFAAGFAWNHSMVLFCILLSLWLFLSIDFSKLCALRLLITGGLSGVAAFTRSTTVFILLLFLVGVFVFADGGVRKKIINTSWFIAGAGISSLWPLSVIVRAPEAFWLNTVKIPSLKVEFLYETGLANNKLALTVLALLSPPYLAIVITGLVVTASFLLQRKKTDGDIKRKSVFCLALTAVMFFIVFIPPTMWLQYWSMPVAFILIIPVYPLYILRERMIKEGRSGILFRAAFYFLIVCVLLSFVYGPIREFKKVYTVFDKSRWAALEIHNISKDIVKKAGGKPILTLSPLYAIEGGGEIYPQFSAGPFIYRVADRLSDKEKEIMNAVGFSDIEGLIERQRPDVIILGTEPKELEEPILKCLKDQWQVKGYGANGPVAYFR